MHINRRQHGEVLVLTIDRPPVNAMNVELLEELVAEIEALSAAPPPAVVIAGRPGCFSAGVDLKAVRDYAPEQQRSMIVGINRMVTASYGLPCPLVAAVTGHAIAGGFVLALGADVRIASTDGRYGLTEVKVGVPFPEAAIRIVRAELTAGAARTLALGSQLLTAAECHSLGAFDEIVAPDAVLDRALEVATDLAELPSDVYGYTKRALRGDTLTAMHAAALDDALLERWIER